MNKDFFKNLLVMDDIILLRYMDTIFPAGIGLIVIYFLLALGENLFAGDLFEIVKETIFSVFLFILWRVICEVLYSVAPDDKK